MINRNNYEEYFLLLADNELSPADEATVKQFAAKHPDLQEELDILLSCRLDTEAMPVFPKKKLLRTTLWNVENPEPLHTQMLLLLDGELPATEQKYLQNQIAASTTLQAEWNSLQPTKLVVEAVAHPHKESLHHDNRKIRPLLWMSWAAAAAVATGLGWLLWTQQKQEITAPGKTLAVAPAYKAIPQPMATPQSSNARPTAIENDRQPAQTTAVNATNTTMAVLATADAPKAQQEKAKTLLPVENAGNANNTYAQPAATEAEPVLATLNSADVQLIPATGSGNGTTQIAHLTAKPVAVAMLTPSSKQDVFTGRKEVIAGEEDDFVTVGGAHINKQKMRGLLRNVTRSVARTFSKSKLEPDAYTTR